MVLASQKITSAIFRMINYIESRIITITDNITETTLQTGYQHISKKKVTKFHTRCYHNYADSTFVLNTELNPMIYRGNNILWLHEKEHIYGYSDHKLNDK